MDSNIDYKNLYNKHSEYYENYQQSKSVNYLYLPFLKKSIGSIKDLEVLDIGCGTGLQIIHLSSQMPKRLVGVDISDGQIEFTKKRLEGKSEAYVVDACDENTRFSVLKKNSFDVIYNVLVTSSMESKEKLTKFLQFSYDALKNGGSLFSFVNETNIMFEYGGCEEIVNFKLEKKKKDVLCDGDEYQFTLEGGKMRLLVIFGRKKRIRR